MSYISGSLKIQSMRESEKLQTLKQEIKECETEDHVINAVIYQLEGASKRIPVQIYIDGTWYKISQI